MVLLTLPSFLTQEDDRFQEARKCITYHTRCHGDGVGRKEKEKEKETGNLLGGAPRRGIFVPKIEEVDFRLVEHVERLDGFKDDVTVVEVLRNFRNVRFSATKFEGLAEVLLVLPRSSWERQCANLLEQASVQSQRRFVLGHAWRCFELTTSKLQ